MPAEKIKNINPEQNSPPDDTLKGAIPSEQHQPVEGDHEPGSNDISEPTMDESESLSRNDPDSADKENKGADKSPRSETSADDSGELSQEEIDAAFNAMNGSQPKEGGSGDVSAGLSVDGISAEAQGGNLGIIGKQPSTSESRLVEGDVNIVKKKQLENFGKPELSGTGYNIDMLLDVTLPISIELGRTSLRIEEILNLGPGSVVELNRLAGEPVDLLVNNKLIAKGEVVVVDENFGVRVTGMVSHEERLKSLV